MDPSAPLWTTMFTSPKFVSLFGIIIAEMAAAAFLAFDGRTGDGLGDRQQVVQVQRRVPAGIVFAMTVGARPARRAPKLGRSIRAPGPFPPRVRTMPTRFCIISCKSCCTWYGPSALPPDSRRDRRAPAPASRACRRSGCRRRVRRGFSLANLAANSPARLPNTIRSERELPPSRFAPCKPAAHFAGGKQAGHGGHLRVAIHADAAHDVMRRRADFHRFLGDVDVGQLLELMIHARQLLLDVLRRVRNFFLDPRDVEEHAAVRAAAARLDFAIDAAGHVVAREQLGRPARVLVALRVAPAFLRDCRRSAICNCPECRRT